MSTNTNWERPGPSCSKLTTSLVNDSLKFTPSDTKICWNFLLKKNVSSCKSYSHFFSAKNIRILCIESAKTVNEMTLNELVKLTTLWTTGPWLGKVTYTAKQITRLYMKRLNKTESPILFFCVLCFQRQKFAVIFYFTAVSVKCRVVAVKRLLELQHSADYIFISSGINEFILTARL